VAGETEAAIAYCGWIRRNQLTPDGQIDGRTRVFQDAWAYRDATFVIGAQAALQYDLSHRLMPHLLRWQDPVSGGFANDREADGSMSDDLDLPYTCGGGFAALATGHLDAARSVAGYLRRIHEVQAHLPERFYCFWSRSRQRPITEADRDFELRMVVENQVDRSQRWTIGGIAAGFLCRLFLADPDPAYLELARRYQEFSMRATDAQFGYPAVCKSSWGSSLLWQVTGDPVYEAWTYRMGDWYVATQDVGGFWHPLAERTLGDVIEVTLEFVMHLDTLVGALAARPGAAG
jgi:hypothetical protein